MALAAVAPAGPARRGDDPLIALNESIDRVLAGEDHDQLCRPLADAIGRLQCQWPYRAGWSAALADSYCWTVAALAQTRRAELYLPQGVLEAREQAARIAHERGDAWAVRELESALARQLAQLDRPAEALERLERAVATFPWDPLVTTRLLAERGVVEQSSNQLAAADVSLELARAEVERARHDALEIDPPTLGLLAHLEFRVELELGRPDHAVVTARRMHRLVETLDDPALRQMELLDQGALELATERWESLSRRVEAALDEPQPWLDAPTRALVLQQRAQADEELGYSEPAALERAAATFREVRATAGVPQAVRREASLRLADVERRLGHLQVAETELAALEPDQLDATERARHATARARLDRARDAPRAELIRARDELQRAYDAFVDEWGAVSRPADGVGFLHYGSQRAVLCELVGLSVDTAGPERGALEALEALLRAQALGTMASELGGEPPTLAEVRQRLCTADRGVLVLLTGPERSFAIAFDRSDAIAVEVAPWRSWKAEQQNWVAELSRSPRAVRDPERRRAEIARLGRALAEELLPPEIERALQGWSGVSILAWAWIGYLPFEALPLGRSELGLELAVDYLPSLSVGCSLARRAAERGAGNQTDTLALLGAALDPPAAVERGWITQAIAPNPERVEALRELFGAQALLVRTRERASFDGLQRLCRERPAILEVLAHGFYDEDYAPGAGFALSAGGDHDGLTRADQIVSLAAPRLVSLAVCGAGRGPLRSGDDGSGNLGGAFLKAGANAVMLAFVDVEQRSTERLFDATYRHMAVRGSSPSEALRDARRELAVADGTADPFYRCLVHVVGRGLEPVLAARPAAPPASAPPTWAWIVLGLAASALLALALARGVTRSRRPRC